jgi:ABC-type molybdate transport system substrate-binding protein
MPIVGFYDYHWEKHNITTDLKTTEKMPSSVKVTHARQVALYVTSNNADARVTYVTPKKCQTYSIENIDEHRKALHQIALKIENFLALSDDPQFFLDITAPDLDSFYWAGPAARQLAYEHWRI